MPTRFLNCKGAVLVAYLGLLLYHEFPRGSNTETQVKVDAQEDDHGPVHLPGLTLPGVSETPGGMGDVEVPSAELNDVEKVQQDAQILQGVGKWFGNHEVKATLTEARLDSVEKRLETFTRMVDNFSKGLDLTWKQIDIINKHYTGEVTTKLKTMMSSVQYFHKQLEALNLQHRSGDVNKNQHLASNFLSISNRLTKVEEKLEETAEAKEVHFDVEEHVPLLREMVKEEVRRHREPNDLSSRMTAVDEATVATINRLGNLEAKVAESERLQAEILTLTDSLIKRDNEINNLTALLLDLIKSTQMGKRKAGPSLQECRSPYLRVGQMCLAITRTPSSWRSAREACQGALGHLALPSNLTQFTRYLRANNISGEVWVAGSELLWSLDPKPPESPKKTTGSDVLMPGKGGFDDANEEQDGDKPEVARRDLCLAMQVRQQAQAVLRYCGDVKTAVCQQRN